ncbi:MAG: ArsB/NhaD family transporter [Candidatus Krumholzibacteriota bacterium]|nr:ArsB/NhaD family transporter [Candidatus Krumholzibacteriota bacterium]
MNQQLIIALSIFILSYVVITTERIHRTKIAIMGGVLLILFHIMEQAEAFDYIDFNTIGLLTGMMLLISVIKETGIFSYLAIRIAKGTGGDGWKILLWFSIFTAVASALLDNVTTVLLIAPITILIAEMLDITPFPFLVAEVIASNIGGTATLIGDPPNILIGSALDLSFMDFILHLGPAALLVFTATLFLLRVVFGKQLKSNSGDYTEVLQGMDESKVIKDRKLLVRSLIVLGLTITAFLIHDLLHLKPATVALAGGGILLIWSGTDIEKRLQEIEWPTLFFFMGLFVLVGGLEKVGVLEWLAGSVLSLSDNLIILSLCILWVSAIASSFLDNIPFVAAMIPLLARICTSLFPNTQGLDEAAYHVYYLEHSLPLWWSLALGACLGGNGTLLGASANVVVAGFSEKTRHPLNFKNYFSYGFPLMLVAIFISSLYILGRYLLWR